MTIARLFIVISLLYSFDCSYMVYLFYYTHVTYNSLTEHVFSCKSIICILYILHMLHMYMSCEYFILSLI